MYATSTPESDATPGGPARSWGGTAWLAAAIAVGALLRCHALRFSYLWLDEFVTLWSIGGAGYRDMLDRALHWTGSGPLFVLCYRATRDVLGPSDAAIKLPGIVTGTLAIWAAWWAARAIFGRKDTALVAAWFVALGPQFIHFSQEARPYMPAVLLGTTGMACVASWLRSGRRAMLAGAMLSLLAAIGFHLFAVLLLPAQGVAVLWQGWSARWPRRRWLEWAAAQLVLLAGLPVVAVQFGMLSGRQSSMLFETSLAMPTRQSLDHDLSHQIAAQAGVALVGLAVWCAARLLPRSLLSEACRSHAPGLRLVAIWFMLPTVLVTVLTELRLIDNWPRYYFLFMPGLVIASAWIATCAFPRSLARVLTAVMLLGMVSEYNLVGGVPSCRLNTAWLSFAEARGELARRTGPTDLVLSRAGLIEGNAPLFLDDPRGLSYLRCFLETGDVPLQAQHVPLPFSVEGPATRAYLAAVARDQLEVRRDFWLVNVSPCDFDYREWVRERFGDEFRKVEERNYASVVLCHYVRPSAIDSGS